jgi:hypothetical protein
MKLLEGRVFIGEDGYEAAIGAAVREVLAELEAEKRRRTAAEKRADQLGKERIRLYGRAIRAEGRGLRIYLRPSLLKLAADLLDAASERFSRHGCNDMKWPAYMTAADRLSMLAAFKAGNQDTSAADLERYYSPGDWLVMSALAKMLRAAAEAESPQETKRMG